MFRFLTFQKQIYIVTRHIKNKNCLFTFLKVENDTKSSPKRGLPQVSHVTNTDRYERLRHIIYIYRESASRFFAWNSAQYVEAEIGKYIY